MIHDTLANAQTYFTLSPRITRALQYLLHPDTAKAPLGKHELEGDKLFALVQEYPTKRPEETFWETHKKYIDVQFMQRGVEAMRWSPKELMKLKQDYDPQRDIYVWEGTGRTIQLEAGSFVIFHPHDAHMGGLLIESPQTVRKIVMKVSVD